MRFRTITIIAALFLFVSCNFRILNGKGIQASPSSGALQSEPTFDKDYIVSNLRGSEGKYTDKIRVTWDEVPGASFYTVKRAKLNTTRLPSLNSDIVKNAEFVEVSDCFEPYFEDKATYLTDKNTFYAYKISATSLITEETTLDSNIVFGSYLIPPQELTVSKGESEDKITIVFSQTPGASQYRIYKSDNGNDLDRLSPIATLNDFTELDDVPYDYFVTPNECGKNLYFAVRSASSDKTLSDISESRVGYTLVQGAPGSVVIGDSGEGAATDGIKVTFEPATVSEGEVYYKIYKSMSGGAEMLMIDTESGDTLEKDDEFGYLYFIDDSARANIKYSYNIVPFNELGIGKSVKVESYLLSPAKSVDLVPVSNSSKLGYQLSIEPPVGFGELNDVVMDITSTFKNNEESTITYRSGDTPIFYNVDKDVEADNEIRSVKVVVRNESTGKTTSSKSTSVSGIPEKPVLKADGKNVVLTNSSGKPSLDEIKRCSGKCTGVKYHNGELCHEIGAYPIVISWESSENAYQYRVKRSDNKQEFVETSNLMVQDKQVEIGKTYDYVLTAEDKLGRNKGGIEIKGCFPAMSAEQFASEYERHIAKPFYFQDEHPDYAVGKGNGDIWSHIRKGKSSGVTEQMGA